LHFDFAAVYAAGVPGGNDDSKPGKGLEGYVDIARTNVVPASIFGAKNLEHARASANCGFKVAGPASMNLELFEQRIQGDIPIASGWGS
jgi:hypothetical protein